MLAPLSGKASESALACTARLNIFEGSVRSGKTVASLIAWLKYTREGPAGNLLMVGKTERTLKRNIIDPLIEWLGPKRCRYIQGAGELWILGRRIYVVGANDERAQDKIRGLTLAGAYVDEVSLLPESFWVMLLTRLSVEGAQLIGTTNPDGPTHWLMRADEPAAGYLLRAALWIDHDGQHHGPQDNVVPLDLHRFSFRLDDNPTLPDAYKEALSQEFTGVWHARLIKGLWVVAEGVIWSEFDPTPDGRHVVTDIPDNVQAWHVGIDDGTAGTFAAQLLALCDDRIVVARELRWNAKEQHRQLTDTQKSAKVADWLDRCANGTWAVDGKALPALPGCNTPTLIHVDPSATSLIRQMELDRWRGVLTLARNDVADGLQYVASLFALDRLQVHESCKGLRQEIPGYVWDPKAAKLGEDKPLKQNDHHCLIAGTLVTTIDGDVPIEQIQVGDQVATREGWRPVRHAGITGVDQPVLRVEMDGGRSLVGTAEHPVWVVDRGWVSLDAIRYGDILLPCPTESKSPSTMESNLGATQTPNGGPIAATGLQGKPTGNAASNVSTKNSGSKHTGLSLPDTTSITPTSTRSTTTSTTSSASPIPPIPKSTESGPSQWANSTRLPNSPDNEQPSGIEVTKDGPGTGSMVDAHGTTANLSPESVSSATPSTKPETSVTCRDSAQTHARAHSGGQAASMISSFGAGAVGQASPLIATPSESSVGVRVLSVMPLASRADVYNLSIQGPPEFFANGVLVHNCDATRYGIMGSDRYWWPWLGSQTPMAA